MRWYDLEPDVCMAISMIECAPPNAQVQYAEYIIKLVQEKDKDFEYIKNITKHVSQKLLKAVTMAVLLSLLAAGLLPAGTVLAEESASFSWYNTIS